MIVAAALAPHTPLLLPTIGKEHRDALKKTLEGIERLKHLLADASPDTIILIKTPEKGRRKRSLFQIQLPESYTVDLSEFGDLVTTGTYPCDTVLGTEITNCARGAGSLLASISDEKLEYTASIPLLALFASSRIKVIVLQPPDMEYDALFSFGKTLTPALQESSKRIVVLAAGDCAHCVRKGKKEAHEQICLPFDYLIIDALQKKSPDAFLSINRRESGRLSACAIPPAIVLRGILNSLSWNAQLLSYEAPFGVGYTVLSYSL